MIGREEEIDQKRGGKESKKGRERKIDWERKIDQKKEEYSIR